MYRIYSKTNYYDIPPATSKEFVDDFILNDYEEIAETVKIGNRNIDLSKYTTVAYCDLYHPDTGFYVGFKGLFEKEQIFYQIDYYTNANTYSGESQIDVVNHRELNQHIKRLYDNQIHCYWGKQFVEKALSSIDVIKIYCPQPDIARDLINFASREHRHYFDHDYKDDYITIEVGFDDYIRLSSDKNFTEGKDIFIATLEKAKKYSYEECFRSLSYDEFNRRAEIIKEPFIKFKVNEKVASLIYSIPPIYMISRFVKINEDKYYADRELSTVYLFKKDVHFVEMLISEKLTPVEKLDLDGKNNLAKARLKAGLTQTELAEKIGISNQQISKLENGERNINQIYASTVVKMAEVLGVRAEDLLELID